MAQFYFDCYRMPEKIKECLDIIQPYYIDLAVNVTNACGVKSCWLGGWRSASAMVSPKIWDEMVLEPGMTLNVEPAVLGGFRRMGGDGAFHVEDLVVITEEGCYVMYGFTRDIISV